MPAEVDEVMDELQKEFPCRQQQIQLLLSLFGEKNHVVPNLFLYGHSATGKTSVIRNILHTLQFHHVIVNCVECYTSRLMFERILNELSGVIPSLENEFSPYARCDNMNDFVRLLKQVVEEKDNKESTIYIVFDKAERLRDMQANLLPGFFRLQELTNLNLCTILISEIVWDKYRVGTGVLEPLVIHFADYTKDELLEILSLDCPDEYPVQFYRGYASLLLSVFHLVCRDLKELRHLAILNFPKYVEPVNTDQAKITDTGKLWRNIEPHLKKALQTVYLREISSKQWEKMQQQNDETSQSTSHSSGSIFKAAVELPFYSKYLLIAAYLASYNPAKYDRRFFTKKSAKVGKRAQLASMKRHERTSNQLLGPKPFPLDRMMAIFYSIVEERVSPSSNVYCQVSSLVTLGLVAQVAGSDHLDSPKYKCLVALDFIKSISRTVNFEVVRYLYDFV